jgi:aminoglycoside 6-adenylyltransferase
VDQQRVFDDVLAWATDDPNVRLVVVTGSFPRGEHDALSDLDIELYVRAPSLLLEETAWYERFGDVLVTEALDNPEWHPTRLVYYVDGKIDFMIASMAVLSEGAVYDGPFLVALDKDGRAGRLEPKVGTSPPSAEEFRTCIEWFYAAAIQYTKAVPSRRPVAAQGARRRPQGAAPADAGVGVRRSDRMGRASAA